MCGRVKVWWSEGGVFGGVRVLCVAERGCGVVRVWCMVE